jgi:hypothetical protein
VTLGFEFFRVSGRPVTEKNQINHGTLSPPAPASLPVFNLYLEVAMTREKTASSTNTIEDGLRQVIRGQSGYIVKQMEMEDAWQVLAFPVIVTTAALSEACFDTAKVSLTSGTITPGDLQLKPLEFCAVNYHAD